MAVTATFLYHSLGSIWEDPVRMHIDLQLDTMHTSLILQSS